MIPKIFNVLPKCVKEIEDDKQLNKTVKYLVLKNNFYSAKEFFSCKFDASNYV
jgi:hypothetical protein